MTAPRLWEIDHPYYATEGCWYVSGTLGHHSRATGYDGNTCHASYASWADFKAGNAKPFTEEMMAARAAAGVVEPTPEEIAGQESVFGRFTFYNCDADLNLLYRWDWFEPDPDDHDEETEGPFVLYSELHLFYILQRKARPQSVHISVTRDDEPEIRAWLATKWNHLQRLWTPFAPDIDPGVSDDERAERTVLHYAGVESPPRSEAVDREAEIELVEEVTDAAG